MFFKILISAILNLFDFFIIRQQGPCDLLQGLIMSIISKVSGIVIDNESSFGNFLIKFNFQTFVKLSSSKFMDPNEPVKLIKA